MLNEQLGKLTRAEIAATFVLATKFLRSEASLKHGGRLLLLKSSTRGRLIESATISTNIICTVFHTNHIERRSVTSRYHRSIIF